MANPQLDDGFTRIANEILEKTQQFKFNTNELKVIMCIWRFTYGFSRKEHGMSLSFFEKHTGLSRGRINQSLKDLERDLVILIKKGNSNTSNSYSFNKDYEKWKKDKYSRFCSTQVDTSSQNATSVQDDTTGSVQDDTTGSVQDDTQERNIKESIKKEEEEEKNPFLFYQENFGIMSPVQSQSLEQWIADFDNNIPVINEAIKQTALTNPRNPFPFLNRILLDWHKRGLVTMEKIQLAIAEHERNKQIRKGTAQTGAVSNEDKLKEFARKNGLL